MIFRAAICGLVLLSLSCVSGFGSNAMKTIDVWNPDNGDGTYRNPIIHADYSDPDVIRVGDDYYLTASSFSCLPGLPVLYSRDLVNWTIIGHAIQEYHGEGFPTAQPGNGVWAPAIRHHDGEYYIYFGDPDRGIFMTKAQNPAGPWTPLHLVKPAKGIIDTCPLWDEDGQAYLVHGWAKSRAGKANILTIARMSPDGKTLLDEGKDVFNGEGTEHRTTEGPKLYKREGWYYILAPAGGVEQGYQLAFRSKDIYGPYEMKTVLSQGKTDINGPHQGGWVTTQTGENWFVHFQDLEQYGRVTHLNPVKWVDGWPVMGIDEEGDGCGDPVRTYKKPNVGKSHPTQVPQTDDEFDGATYGLQWQWMGNYEKDSASTTAREGWLRLKSRPLGTETRSFFYVARQLTQKLPAPVCAVTTRMDTSSLCPGEQAGLTIYAATYGSLLIRRSDSGFALLQAFSETSPEGNTSAEEATVALSEEQAGKPIDLRLSIAEGAKCQFEYSFDGNRFIRIGETFTPKQAKWIGVKVGLIAIAPPGARQTGFADFDYFRWTK